MTKYRDGFNDPDLSSVVGNGLDRLNRDVSEEEVRRAINFYLHYKEAIETFPIGARRQAIEEFVRDSFTIPDWIISSSDNILKGKGASFD